MSESWPEIQQAKEKAKRDLKLSGPKVSERVVNLKGLLPESVWNLDLLTKLEICSIPGLEQLSPNILKLGALKELVVSDVPKLGTLPSEISKLSELKTLIVENANQKELPKEFGKYLKNLQVLNLSGNQLSSLNEDFKIPELVTLNLNGNCFTNVPIQILKLQRISTLSLCRNQIDSINPEMANMAGLQILDISNNKLTEVPTFLGNSPKLKDLKLDGNPFKDKKFIKMLESGKTKNLVQQLKKMSPKPKKEETSIKEYRIKLLSSVDSNRVIVSSRQTSRPYLLMALVRGIDFTESSYKEFIDLQTEIHQNLCKKRTLAAIGTHDYSAIKPPCLYDSSPPQQIKFIPLRLDYAVSGVELLDYFKQTNDQTMLKYISIIEKQDWPVLYDNSKEVLSVPPVMNSKYSQISVDTQDVLIECSSSESIDICYEVMNTLLDKFGNLLKADISNQMIVETIKVVSENGHLRVKYPTEEDLIQICKNDE